MRIKELREERCLSQANLASAIDTSQRNIGRWENEENEPTYSQLVKLADYFNVSIDYLVGREDDFGNINVAGQLTDQLTTDERELLSCFNATDFAGREALLISARALAGKKEKLKER